MSDMKEELSNRQKLVFHLMDKGLSNDEVARTLADVAEAAFEQFTTEAMRLFTDEDKKAIEAADSDINADEEIKKRFSDRSGEDADAYLERLIEEHASSYMSEQSESTPAVQQ